MKFVWYNINDFILSGAEINQLQNHDHLKLFSLRAAQVRVHFVLRNRLYFNISTCTVIARRTVMYSTTCTLISSCTSLRTRGVAMRWLGGLRPPPPQNLRIAFMYCHVLSCTAMYLPQNLRIASMYSHVLSCTYPRTLESLPCTVMYLPQNLRIASMYCHVLTPEP